MKIKAEWVTCGSNKGEHAMLDNCWNCAPFWWDMPICPIKHKSANRVWNSLQGEHYPLVQKKLNPSGYCKDCKKFYDIIN